jgi:uncharacterized protein (TIGR03067 family)
MRLIVPLILFALPLWAAPAPFLPRKMTPAEADWKALQGEWEMIRCNYDGRKDEPDSDHRMVYARGRLTILQKRVVPIVHRITLDTSRSPRVMRHGCKVEGEWTHLYEAIYLLEGDTLTECVAYSRRLPSKFTPCEGVIVLVFKRKRP